MTGPADIFLSYNREDQATARRFAEAFEAAGFSVWWDTTLRAGEAYDEVTEQALRGAKAVVVLWSPRSVVSRWVRAEATLADRNKTLVPCTIEPCERPIMFELTQTAELSHWQGAADDKAWAAFLSDVKRFVAKDLAPATGVSAPSVTAPTVQETLKPGQSGSAPSLAILPFTNRSALAEDEVFAEGMVEDVISALSQGVNVRVLGSTATANLSRAAITDLAAVGRQLGVQYLLEGNVRRAGANLRVTTQLLEAASGAVMWTAKFDRPLTELGELQEALVMEIAASLDAQVFRLEMERALKKPGDLTAWEAMTRAVFTYRRMDATVILSVIADAKRAITIAPDYGPAYAMLASAEATLRVYIGDDDPEGVQRIRAIGERALELTPEDSQVLGSVGNALNLLGFPEEGVRYTERSVRKSPGNGIAHHFHGGVCMALNRPLEGLSHFDTAMRLMPGSYLIWLIMSWRSRALVELGRFEEAEAATDESIAMNPTFGPNYLAKARICLRIGQDAEIRRHMDTARRLGVDLALAERMIRRVGARSPTLEADIAAVRALYAATEPGT